MNKFSFRDFIAQAVKPLPFTYGFLQLVPKGISGVYILYNNSQIIYTGRSDHDLKKRLSLHNHRWLATHFTYFPCKCKTQAYIFEKQLYYTYTTNLNKVYPSYPVQDLHKISKTLSPIFKK